MRKTILLRALAVIVAVGCAAPVRGAYIVANLNSNPLFTACGTYDGSSPGAPCYLAPNVNPVSVSGQDNGGAGQALTGYGVNKVIASSGVGGGMNANSEWQVTYGLTGATAGSQVNLVVTFGYDVTVSVGPGEAGLSMVVNNNFFTP